MNMVGVQRRLGLQPIPPPASTRGSQHPFPRLSRVLSPADDSHAPHAVGYAAECSDSAICATCVAADKSILRRQNYSGGTAHIGIIKMTAENVFF